MHRWVDLSTEEDSSSRTSPMRNSHLRVTVLCLSTTQWSVVPSFCSHRTMIAPSEDRGIEMLCLKIKAVLSQSGARMSCSSRHVTLSLWTGLWDSESFGWHSRSTELAPTPFWPLSRIKTRPHLIRLFPGHCAWLNAGSPPQALLWWRELQKQQLYCD